MGALLNTDQSGFTLELLSHRTLETCGTQQVYSNMQSKSANTHSYTAQFLITASGELKAPLFLILPEKGGNFGPRVASTMFRHPELHVVSSTSGKITKPLLKDWFKNVFFPNVPSDSVLLLDSLTTYKDRAEIDAEKPHDKNYSTITIPGGLTGQTQPLDVYFNRPYKAFLRRISDFINYYCETTIKLHLRDTILKLQTLTHNQFRSPRFKGFIKHAWEKSGLIAENELSNNSYRFEDPNDFCFSSDCILRQSCSSCDNSQCFIRCAWCKAILCFKDFYFEFHFCENFIP